MAERPDHCVNPCHFVCPTLHLTNQKPDLVSRYQMAPKTELFKTLTIASLTYFLNWEQDWFGSNK